MPSAILYDATLCIDCKEEAEREEKTLTGYGRGGGGAVLGRIAQIDGDLVADIFRRARGDENIGRGVFQLGFRLAILGLTRAPNCSCAMPSATWKRTPASLM